MPVGAEVVLERRLRLPKRWWEAADTGLPSSRSPAGIDSNDDGEVATMDKSSTGVVEVYVITAGSAIENEANAAGESLELQRRSSAECNSESSDDGILFS